MARAPGPALCSPCPAALSRSGLLRLGIRKSDSQAPINPQLRKEIENLGQIASDLFGRPGHTGRVSLPILRAAALIPRRLLWKRVEPG